MEQNEVLKLLGSVGAIITDDHIVYTSGKHGTAYVNKDALYPHTAQTSLLCKLMAQGFARDGIEAVIAPALGGIVLSQWVSYHLSELSGQEVFALYAEKDGAGNFIVKRGYEKLLPGKRILVVEDVLTTGTSAKQVVEVTQRLGGEVVALSVLCNRGGVTPADIGNVPRLSALVDIKMQAWEASVCPLCEQKVSINTAVGKGREFLASKGA